MFQWMVAELRDEHPGYGPRMSSLDEFILGSYPFPTRHTHAQGRTSALTSFSR